MLEPAVPVDELLGQLPGQAVLLDLLLQQRQLAERTLALEQYQLSCVKNAADPAAGEKKLEQLRRRWASLSASVERIHARVRARLDAEAAMLEQRLQQLHDREQSNVALQVELMNKLSAWEQEQSAWQAEQENRQRELTGLRHERDQHQAQVQSLRLEVERLARLLIQDSGPSPLLLGRAA